MLLGARDVKLGVLPWEEVHLRRVYQLEHQALHVVGERLDLLDLSVHQLQRNARLQHALVVAEELDLQVAIGVGAAQKDVPLLLLELVEGEGGPAVHLQISVQKEGLARRALPFLAPVHQHHAVLERRLEYSLVFVYLDLDVDRLEANFVFLTHDLVIYSLKAHTYLGTFHTVPTTPLNVILTATVAASNSRSAEPVFPPMSE